MSEKMMICPNGDGKGKCKTGLKEDCSLARPHEFTDIGCRTDTKTCPACIPVPSVVAEPGFEIAPVDYKAVAGVDRCKAKYDDEWMTVAERGVINGATIAGLAAIYPDYNWIIARPIVHCQPAPVETPYQRLERVITEAHKVYAMTKKDAQAARGTTIDLALAQLRKEVGV